MHERLQNIFRLLTIVAGVLVIVSGFPAFLRQNRFPFREIRAVRVSDRFFNYNIGGGAGSLPPHQQVIKRPFFVVACLSADQGWGPKVPT